MTVFSEIYRGNLWNGVESRSGPGSGSAATEQVARDLLALVHDLGVRSVLDVGCGDSFWMPNLPNYIGVDIAPEAVALARERHPDRHYAVLDLRTFDHPWSDLVIVRDVIQHLPLADGVAMLDSIRAGGCRWLLASTYQGGDNVDVAAGDCYSPDLEAEPFDLGRPERTIFDGYGYGRPGEIRDDRKFLALWPIGSHGLTERTGGSTVPDQQKNAIDPQRP